VLFVRAQSAGKRFARRVILRPANCIQPCRFPDLRRSANVPRRRRVDLMDIIASAGLRPVLLSAPDKN
jgi:hypothetical protein